MHSRASTLGGHLLVILLGPAATVHLACIVLMIHHIYTYTFVYVCECVFLVELQEVCAGCIFLLAHNNS